MLDPALPVGTFTDGTNIYAEPLAEQQLVLTVMGTVAGIALLRVLDE